jgi:lipopolysaccharide export system ATP-binding protein
VGIDPIAIEEIQDIILNLKDQGIGCLITDHSVHQAMRIIDICYVVYNGEIIVGDIKQNVVNNPRVRELYLGVNFNY